MINAIKQEDDYSLKYYQLLIKYVSKPKDYSKLYLETLVNSKIRDLKANSSPKSKDSILKLLLDLSLYFIKDNNFISEEYFSLINNKIYKNFYELFVCPTESQMKKFFKSFFELDYGASTIFLICTKLCNEGAYIPFDLFFSIIIKKNIIKLQEILKTDFPIEKNHEKLIQRLACFTKIKNKIEVKKNDILDLFRAQKGDEIKSNESIIINNNNLVKVNYREKEENINNSQIINKESDNTNKHNEKKKNEINSKDADIDENLNIRDENKFFKHLLEMKKKYKLLKYETPVLDYLIKNKKKLKKEYFKYAKNEEVIIDHLYDNLEKLIIELNLNIINFQEEKYGYFCYQVIEKNEKKYVESIYSIVNLQILSDRISSDLNFPKDYFKIPDKQKAQNAFKSRALSFEYFINNNILIRKYGFEEKARVIYKFKSIDELEPESKNEIIIKNKAEEKGLEELDAVIFVNNKESLALEKNCFIIDNPYKFSSFIGKDKNNFVQEYDNEVNKKVCYPLNIELEKNTLALIEIKNQFPPYEEGKEKEKTPFNFYHMVKGLIKKAKIFKQIYQQSSKKIQNIKLILFYDVIQKENYFDELKRAVYDSFKKNDPELFDFEFQCVYIKASYLAGGLMNLNNIVDDLNCKVDYLERNVNNLNRKLDLLIGFISGLDLPKVKFEQFQLLVNQNYN